MRNTNGVRKGDLLLLDAGVETDALYTADITRTLPVSGEFTDAQRKVYQAVLDAQNAGFKVAKVGHKFQDVHNAAIDVLAARLMDWGIIPKMDIALIDRDNGPHRRYMIHGVSHHLGIDVHDCAQARDEMYLDGDIQPGMIFTIEPGLYFKADDLTVPAEFRGIGVRIEDDVLITKDGNENLSATIPRNPEHVLSWISKVQAKAKK
jgi:Xaa-Pro aminopeptidase